MKEKLYVAEDLMRQRELTPIALSELIGTTASNVRLRLSQSRLSYDKTGLHTFYIAERNERGQLKYRTGAFKGIK